MSRKALAVLGSTPPKHLPALTASPQRRAPVATEDEAAALLLVNPSGSSSGVNLRLRGNTF
jgi:hypothetical protein